MNPFRVIRIKSFVNFLNSVGLLVTCLILCQFLISELIGALWTCLRTSNSSGLPGLLTVPHAQGFMVSPLNTVAKRDLEERRVINDSSRWCGHSVNDGVGSDTYLGEPLALCYPRIDVIVDAVVTLGRGCHLYKCDLRNAYCQFLMDPKDYPFLGYTWDNHFYLDIILTMWLRSADLQKNHACPPQVWLV